MTEIFKIVKGFEAVDGDKFFTAPGSVCRVHSLKLCKQHVKLNVKMFFFTQRIISVWNDLLEKGYD